MFTNARNDLMSGSNWQGEQIHKFCRSLYGSNSGNNQFKNELVDVSLKVFDRLFGEDATTGESVIPTPWVRSLEKGGWLRKLVVTDAGSAAQREYKDVIVKLFIPTKDPVSMLKETRIGIKLSLFPTKFRLAVLGNQCYLVVQSPNQHLFHSLLQPSRDSMQTDPTLKISAFAYYLISLVRYPTVAEYIFASSPSVATANGVGSRLQSFSFSSLPRGQGITTWLCKIPYLQLLWDYMNQILPVSQSSMHVTDDGKLLLCLCAEFWMDTALIARIRSPALALPQSPAVGTPGQAQSSCLDMMFLQAEPVRTTPSLQCVYLVVLQVLANAHLCNDFAACVNQAVSSPSRHFTGSNSSSVPEAWKIIQQPLFDMLRAIFSRIGQVPSAEPVLVWAVEIWLLILCPWKASQIIQSGIMAGERVKVSVVQWQAYIACNHHFYSTLMHLFLTGVERRELSVGESAAEQPRALDLLERVIKVIAATPGLEDLFEDMTFEFVKQHRGGDNLQLQDAGSIAASPARRSHSVTMVDIMAMQAQHGLLFPDVPFSAPLALVSIRKHCAKNGNDLMSRIQQLIIYHKHKSSHTAQHLVSLVLDRAEALWERVTGATHTPAESGDETVRRLQQLLATTAQLLGCPVPVVSIAAARAEKSSHAGASHSISAGAEVRDELGHLNELGRQLVSNGQLVCNKDDLKYLARDELRDPIASDEWKPLARYLIRLSKDFNLLFGGNRDVNRDSWSWALVGKEVWNHFPTIGDTFTASFRFNLRPIANKRLWLLLALCLLTVRVTLSGISWAWTSRPLTHERYGLDYADYLENLAHAPSCLNPKWAPVRKLQVEQRIHIQNYDSCLKSRDAIVTTTTAITSSIVCSEIRCVGASCQTISTTRPAASPSHKSQHQQWQSQLEKESSGRDRDVSRRAVDSSYKNKRSDTEHNVQCKQVNSSVTTTQCSFRSAGTSDIKSLTRIPAHSTGSARK